MPRQTKVTATANRRFGRPVFIVLALWLVLAMPGAALAQTALSTATSSPSGLLDAAVTIPASTAPGMYDITATGLAPVASAYPPSTTVSITLSRTSVTAGETLRVSGTGWSPSTPVTLRLQLVSLSEASLTLAQATEVRTVSARLRVVAPGASGNKAAVGSGGSDTPLSRTGTTVLPLLVAGLGTILLGTVMVSSGRRRHRAKTSTL